MRTIIVADEAIMLRRFRRISSKIPDIQLIGCFEDAESAIRAMEEDPADLAFLDIDMPIMNGLELARKLREIRKDLLIVFLTAHDEYIRASNEIGGDYYLIKPYSGKTLELAMERLRLIGRRQEKNLYIRTFGRFLVMRGNEPLPFTGRAKEILALLVARRGKEVSNEEIFRTLWENRPYSNRNMTVYYNAVRRLKDVLEKTNTKDLLITTKRGKRINTDMFECDYYDWQDSEEDERTLFEGEFMSEYSWGEAMLADIMERVRLGLR